MPFARKGTAALTERLDVRVAPEEKEQLRRIAAGAGISVAELIRRGPSTGPSCPVPTPRQSASCVGSAACSRRSTSTAAAPIAGRRPSALAALRAAIVRLAGGDGGAP